MSNAVQQLCACRCQRSGRGRLCVQFVQAHLSCLALRSPLGALAGTASVSESAPHSIANQHYYTARADRPTQTTSSRFVVVAQRRTLVCVSAAEVHRPRRPWPGACRDRLVVGVGWPEPCGALCFGHSAGSLGSSIPCAIDPDGHHCLHVAIWSNQIKAGTPQSVGPPCRPPFSGVSDKSLRASSNWIHVALPLQAHQVAPSIAWSNQTHAP